MSFFGGGTDYRPFFEEHGGSVLTTTFNKYCYVMVRHLPPFFNHKTQVTYSRIEQVLSPEELQHPMVREAIKYLDMHELHIIYDADLPARSGLGSSSSFAVGLIQAFYALKGKYVSNMQLAEDAIHVERVLCKENGGEQDQVAVALGGLNRINFSANGTESNPIIISKQRKKEFQDHLLLFFTGISRVSSEIAESQVKATRDKTAELLEMLQMVDEGERILTTKTDICDFGRLLDHSWKIKRNLTNNISNNEIDEIYKKAIDIGAVGGKLLGAGGGGFFIVFAKPEYHQAIIKKLDFLLHVPFEFEENGSKILYYQPEDFVNFNK